jgi:hypothetical protein
LKKETLTVAATSVKLLSQYAGLIYSNQVDYERIKVKIRSKAIPITDDGGP